MSITFLSALFCILSALVQCIFLGSPEYLLSLDPLRIGASAVVSTILFLIADIINERYGFKATMRTIVLGVLAQVVVIVSAGFVGWSVLPSLAAIGLLGLFSGEAVDAAVYAGMHRLTGERHLLLRTFCSTTLALVVEGLMLFFAAQTLVLIAPQFTWKFLGSLLNLPIIMIFRERLFKKETGGLVKIIH